MKLMTNDEIDAIIKKASHPDQKFDAMFGRLKESDKWCRRRNRRNPPDATALINKGMTDGSRA